MRVLVTGVSGFVGAHLVSELVGAGHRVWGTDRMGSAIDGLEGGTAFHCDLLIRSEVHRLVTTVRPDAVVHLAAQSSPAQSWEQPGETMAANAAATAHVVAEAAGTNPRVTFLLVSSSDVYGRSEEGRDEFTEESALRPQTPYAVSKVAAEQVATLLAQRAGIRLVIARPFSHTGPGQTDRFVVPAFARQIAEIEAGEATDLLHGDLEPSRDFTDVRDVVRAYRLLLEKPGAAGVFNVCSGVAVSIEGILKTLCSMAKTKISACPDPSRKRGESANAIHGNAGRLERATGWDLTIPLKQTLADVLEEQRLAVAQRMRAEAT